MKIQYMIRPRFPTGPDTVIDVPLDGPMSSTLTQDHSQNGNHATLANSPVFQYPGLLCDQTDESTAWAALTTGITMPVTIICWAKVPTAGTNLIYLGLIDAGTPYVKLKVQVGGTQKPRARYVNSGDDPLAQHPTGGFADSKWHHYAGVLASITSLKLYVDGVFIAEDTTESVDEVASITQYAVAGNTFNSGDPGSPSIDKTHTSGGGIVELRELLAAEIKNHFELTRHKFGV